MRERTLLVHWEPSSTVRFAALTVLVVYTGSAVGCAVARRSSGEGPGGTGTGGGDIVQQSGQAKVAVDGQTQSSTQNVTAEKVNEAVHNFRNDYSLLKFELMNRQNALAVGSTVTAIIGAVLFYAFVWRNLAVKWGFRPARSTPQKTVKEG